MTLTTEQRDRLRKAMGGNKNNRARQPIKWRVGVAANAERQVALTKAGIEWDWTSAGYVGISTKFDSRATQWIDSIRKLGYKVKYFNQRPNPEDVLVI
jgi:hypothetical protein